MTRKKNDTVETTAALQQIQICLKELKLSKIAELLDDELDRLNKGRLQEKSSYKKT